MNRKLLEKKLTSMVEEDQGLGDLTADIVPDKNVKAEIVAKECCRISGVYELTCLFHLFGIDILSSAKDADQVNPEQRVFILSGSGRDILLVERTALNILSRMSAITTHTREYVKAAREKNPKVRVAATRKTTPFFAYFEKKAVRLGGGDTHRLGLYDMAMIKDNHLRLFQDVATAVAAARKEMSFTHKLEVEVSSKEDAVSAAGAGADIIMLDNMTPGGVGEAICALEEAELRSKVLIEASGGITKENIAQYAACDLDIISVGALTHSAGSMDFSLKIL